MVRIISFGTGLFLATVLVACSGGSSEEMVANAKAYLDEGEVRTATIELKNALQKDGENAEARFLLGKIHLERGDVESAEKELRRARALGYPDNAVVPLLAQVYLELRQGDDLNNLTAQLEPDGQATVLAAKGLLALLDGDFNTARSLIGEARALSPDSKYASQALARYLATQGDIEGAVDELSKLLARDESNALAWTLMGDLQSRLNDLEAADAAYTAALDHGFQDFSNRLRRANLRVARKDFAAAQEDSAILAARAPKHPGTGYIQGLLAFYQENYQEAVFAFTLAENDSGRYPLALMYLAISHYVLGNSDQAEKYGVMFHEIQPGNVGGRKILATVRLEQRNFEQVEALILPVVEEAPTDVDALNLLANAMLGLGRTDEAVNLFGAIAELEPDSSVAQVRLGASMLMEGDSAVAVERLEAALELDPKFQQADMLIALNYVRQKDFDKAIQAANGYLQRNPDDVNPHNLLGRIYLAAGRESEAVAAFNDALKIAPGDPSANHNLARLAKAEGDSDKARRYYETVLKYQENSLRSLIMLAMLDAEAGDEQSMEKRLRAAMEAHPKAVQPRVILAKYYLTKRKPEQVSVLLNDLDEEAQNLPEVLRQIAIAQITQRNFIQAEFTLQQEISLRPDDAEGHFLLASVYEGQGKRDELFSELAVTLDLDPSHYRARLARARLYFADRNWRALEPDLKILVETVPDKKEVLKLRAAVANQQGNQGKALELLERNQQLAPTTDGMVRLARQQAAMGDTQLAIETRELWLKENPDDMAARTELAMQYGEMGRIDDAVKEYQAVIEAYPNEFFVLNNLAWHLRKSNPAEALKYAQRAVDANPNSAEALDTLAMIQLDSGDPNDAQRNIERALEILPDHPSMQYHSAQIQLALGDSASARLLLGQLLKNDTEFPEREDAIKLRAGLLD